MLCWLPLVDTEVQDSFLGESHSFCLKQLALERGVRLADEEFSAGADYTMPRDSFSAWTRGHGVSGGASSTRKLKSFGQLAIRHCVSPRDFLDEFVYRLPIHRICPIYGPVSGRTNERSKELIRSNYGEIPFKTKAW